MAQCHTRIMTANRIKILRQRKGWSQADLADAVGSDQATIARLERGDRRLSLPWMDKISAALDCRPQDLLPAATVPVVGYVGAGAEVYPVDDHAPGDGLDEVDAPPGAGPDAVAVIVRGDSQYPMLFDGDVLIYWNHLADPGEARGRLCVVHLADGRTLVKNLQRGTETGCFTLTSVNAPPIENVEISWAARVQHVDQRDRS